MENLATDVIKGLIKVIIVLIITNVVTVLGFLIYLSIPIEYDNEVVTQEAEDEGVNSFIGGNYINGETNSEENKN